MALRDKFTEEEINELVGIATERLLLKIPTVVGNLFQRAAEQNKLTSDFYKTYPQFQNHKDVVVAVVAQLESDSPFAEYDDILNKAVPIIEERIKIKGTLDMQNIAKRNPKRDFSSFKPDTANGAL